MSSDTPSPKLPFAGSPTAAAQLYQTGHSWIAQHFFDSTASQRTRPTLPVSKHSSESCLL
jgi:hypothetical protein